MPIHEYQEFPDFKLFKTAMQDWALTSPTWFSFRYQKFDCKRNVVQNRRALPAGCDPPTARTLP